MAIARQESCFEPWLGALGRYAAYSFHPRMETGLLLQKEPPADQLFETGLVAIPNRQAEVCLHNLSMLPAPSNDIAFESDHGIPAICGDTDVVSHSTHF